MQQPSRAVQNGVVRVGCPTMAVRRNQGRPRPAIAHSKSISAKPSRLDFFQNRGRLLMDKTLTRIRLITEELYLVRDELNKRAATQSAELSSALFEREGANELIAFK